MHPVGGRALLVECRDGAEVRGLRAALDVDPPTGLGEMQPGARTLLVHLTPAAAADPRLADRLAGVLAELPALPEADHPTTGDVVVIETVYDGADLADVAAALGTSPAAVVAAHTERSWTASFVGFAPGFAYLEPDGDPLDVPRRATPRTAVPAGSVALAGPYSAVYPRRSPGGGSSSGGPRPCCGTSRGPSPRWSRPGRGCGSARSARS